MQTYSTDWMTPSEAASYLRVSQFTLTRWRYLASKGIELGPPFSAAMGRQAIRYRKEDLEAWMLKSMATSTQQTKALRPPLPPKAQEKKGKGRLP